MPDIPLVDYPIIPGASAKRNISASGRWGLTAPERLTIGATQ